MFQIATEERFKDGQIIFEEGSYGDWVYLVEEGSVEIYKTLGKQKIVIDILKPGDFFGELAFFSKQPRYATAQAIGGTVVSLFDREGLDGEFNKLASEFRALVHSLAAKLKNTTEKSIKNQFRAKDRKDGASQKALAVKYKSDQEFISAFTPTVEGGGVFIRTPLPFPQGDQFMLNLNFTNTDLLINISCEVLWSRKMTDDPIKTPKGMGVKFINLDPDTHKKLNDILRSANIKI